MVYRNNVYRMHSTRELSGVGVYRRMASAMRFRLYERANYLSIARDKLAWARKDRLYAVQDGWRLP